jgi:hypothetical protein
LNTSFPIENRAKLSAHELGRLACALSPQRSIKQAVDWWVGQHPPLAPSGMVTQDEFSHDIIVALPGGLWLVYDTT